MNSLKKRRGAMWESDKAGNDLHNHSDFAMLLIWEGTFL